MRLPGTATTVTTRSGTERDNHDPPLAPPLMRNNQRKTPHHSVTPDVSNTCYGLYKVRASVAHTVCTLRRCLSVGPSLGQEQSTAWRAR